MVACEAHILETWFESNARNKLTTYGSSSVDGTLRLGRRGRRFESYLPYKMQMSHSDLLHLTSNQDFVGLNPTICTKQLPFSIMVITCDFDS